MRTAIAAHRGGAALWPENSAAAFRGAAGLAVEQIEFDVQLTADGEPVIFHDALLDRMTDGHGPLAERTLAELERLEIEGGGGHILTLDAGLDLLAPSSLLLRCEFKPDHRLAPYPGIVERVVARLEARDLLARTIFTSFHLPTIESVLDLPIHGATWLIPKQTARLVGADALVALTRHVGVRSVSLHQSQLDDALLARFRGAGLGVGAFGVVDEATMEHVLRQPVDMFTADRPDIALRVRERVQGAGSGGGAHGADGPPV